MRLLNTKTLELEEYFGSQIPEYAILSHCWGVEEVTFQDIHGSAWRTIAGAKKITNASVHAQSHLLDYIWIDTCCIDKSSSAELSEAINSMYSWYEDSKVCYVYLEDITINQFGAEVTEIEDQLRGCRWFTRGWTLQELVAPWKIEFFDTNWEFLGSKAKLSSLLSSITAIPEDILANPSKRLFTSVAKKMTWAAGRKTTRMEDVAYSLLGIFGVNMPLLYGEGDKAFIRLQEEIIKETDDQSLFCWGVMIGPDMPRAGSVGFLAQSPAAFVGSENIVPFPSGAGRTPHVMTNKGLRIELPLHTIKPKPLNYVIAMLDCHVENDFTGSFGLALRPTADPSVFVRRPGCGIRKYSIKEVKDSEVSTIYIGKYPLRGIQKRSCMVHSESVYNHGYQLHRVIPSDFLWSDEVQTLQMPFYYPLGTKEDPGNSEMQRKSWAAFIFYNPTTDDGFLVALSLVSVASEFIFGLTMSSVEFIAKPREAGLEAWVEECERARLRSSFEHGGFLQAYSMKAGDTGPAISVEATRAEILKQEVFVLEIKMEESAA